MSTTTPNLGLFKYNTTTDSNVPFSIDDALNANWDILDENIGSRNIGEIVSSTIPLTDAGLHLLDGSLINGSGIYSDFVDYIARLDLTANYFCTESEWQASVTQYGVCGKFVYDSVNNTVRLPKYSNKIYTQEFDATAPVIGNGMTLGLTDGTKNYGHQYSTPGGNQSSFPSTNAYGVPLPNTVPTGSYPPANSCIGVSTDPTKSGLIAQLSDITTSLDGYYYIVVATSTKTDIQVDIDEIATDLNGKADVDLANVNDQAKILMGSMGMPSDKFVVLTVGASGSTYTAPANGWFCIAGTSTSNSHAYVQLDTPSYIQIRCSSYSSSTRNLCYLPVKKGDIVKLTYANQSSFTFTFTYSVGSESEAS